jgi:hypothetical protein
MWLHICISPLTCTTARTFATRDRDPAIYDTLQWGKGRMRWSCTSPMRACSLSPPIIPTAHFLSHQWGLDLQVSKHFTAAARPSFPESFEIKGANKLGAPVYMKTLIQHARSSKLTITFIFTSDGTPGRTYSLYHHIHNGDILDLRFPRCTDAKAAVCLVTLEITCAR